MVITITTYWERLFAVFNDEPVHDVISLVRTLVLVYYGNIHIAISATVH